MEIICLNAYVVNKFCVFFFSFFISAKILIFYVIFYAALAGFFAAIFAVFYQTLEMNKPKWILEKGLIGTNPGKHTHTHNFLIL